MLTVKLTCQKCNKEFSFSPSDFSIKGLTNIPKKCPYCIDTENKLTKPVVERICLDEFENVQVSKEIFQIAIENENALYQCFIYGGRNFGKYGGARYTNKYLFFIHNDLLDKDIFICNIRKMLKTYEFEGKVKQSIYFVLNPSNSEIPNYYLYEIKSWYKTTLKGYGKDRDYKEYPYIEDNTSYYWLCKTSSYCNSGRYGNEYKLLIVNKPIKITGEGIQ